MQATTTSIPGLIKIQPRVIPDSRGFFAVPYSHPDWEGMLKDLAQKEPAENIRSLVEFEIKQFNHSHSVRGVLRGSHAEPWSKYIYIAKGEVFAAIVDCRKGNNFGKLETFIRKTGESFFVPKGCANSFQVISESVDYQYLVDGLWQPNTVYPSIRYDDPSLQIPWPVPNPIVSEKDLKNPLFQGFKPLDWL